MLSAPQGALSMKNARTKIILDGEKFINTIKKNKKRIRLQALKRVGPPLKNQGSSSLDSLQALGYYKIMNKKEAKEITGGLSAPGKMPEGAYSISALHCKTGAKLRLIKNTPCHGCYA